MHNSSIAIQSGSPVIESLETLGCGLHPILHAKWETLIGQNSGLIESLLRKHGAPLHLVAPSILCENLQKLQDTIHQHGVKSQVLYAMKANKGRALVRHAANAGFGIDVASEHEFSMAAAQSQESTAISLSGPVKPNSLFEAAIQRGAFISIDSVEELRSLRNHLMVSRPKKKAKVYLRHRPTFIKSSRFGMSEGDVRICSRLLTEFNVMIEFVGFHFHLPGYSAAA